MSKASDSQMEARMNSRIVIFDLETGGLEAKPSIMSRPQWDALEKYGRGPKPAFRCFMGRVEPFGTASTMSPKFEWTRGAEDAPWMYCPGNPITQIAAMAVRADTLEPIEEFEVKLLFRPELAVAEALEVNSYDAETWASEAIPYPRGLADFCAYLRRHATVEMTSKAGKPYRAARLGGHNAASFDLDFILRSCQDPFWQRYALPGDRSREGNAPKGLFFPGGFQVLDTLHLARWHFANHPKPPENMQLSTLAEYFEIDAGDAHDALADVKITREILIRLREGFQS